MNVNGFTAVGDAYSSYLGVREYVTTQREDAETVIAPVSETGVVYEPTQPSKLYQANKEVIARLSAHAAEKRTQFEQLVHQLIIKQGTTFGAANDMWNFLREGKYEVSPEIKAQAQADIAEDGYWGVEQTSERIVDFAVALTGGNPDNLDKMVDAFKKGYAQAEKTWGGKLPEISKKTYDAVIAKFDELNSVSTTTN